MHGANDCYPDSCKWIALLQLDDLFLFLHMFIVHGCGILINFYPRIMLIGLNMRIKVIRFLVPLSQRGDLYLQSGSRRRYIIHLISLSFFRPFSLFGFNFFFKTAWIMNVLLLISSQVSILIHLNNLSHWAVLCNDLMNSHELNIQLFFMMISYLWFFSFFF